MEFGESFRNLAESIYPSKVPFKQTKVWPTICHRPVALVQQNLLRLLQLHTNLAYIPAVLSMLLGIRLGALKVKQHIAETR